MTKNLQNFKKNNRKELYFCVTYCNILKQETGTATTLIVAQRIGTIMDADKIIVLDEGKIVGIGRHKELLKSCPVYREIAESQLSKEELESA